MSYFEELLDKMTPKNNSTPTKKTKTKTVTKKKKNEEEESLIDEFVRETYGKFKTIAEANTDSNGKSTIFTTEGGGGRHFSSSGREHGGSSSAILTADEYNALLAEEEKKEREKREFLGLDLFQKGAWEGYEPGKVTDIKSFFDETNEFNKKHSQAMLGTMGDVGLDIIEGGLNMVEGITDVAGWLLYGGNKYLAKDDEAAEKIKEAVEKDSVSTWLEPADKWLEQYSVFGDTTDQVAQGVGQVAATMGIGAIGKAAGAAPKAVSFLTKLAQGTSAFGNAMSEAYKGGATDGEALGYGAISATAEVLFESLFDGMGKTAKSLGFDDISLSNGADDWVASKVSSFIKNPQVKNVVQGLVKGGFEGVEELLTGFVQGSAKKIYDDEKTWAELLKDENLWEQFFVGMLTGDIMQAGDVAKANKSGRDLITGLNADETTVVDKIVDERIEKKTKETGKELTGKQKAEIREQAMEDLENGNLDVDDIERILGGDSYNAFDEAVKGFESNETYKEYQDALAEEKALQTEFDELSKVKTNDADLGQQARFNELRQKLEELKTNSKSGELWTQLQPEADRLNQLRAKLRSETMKRFQDENGKISSKLAESYLELQRSNEKFKVDDFSKYKGEHSKQTINNILESGLANNSNKMHRFVDFIAKISDEKGVVFSLTDAKKLAGTIHDMKGAVANAFVDGNEITLNTDSKKMVETTVGHEITHVLEGTEFYDTLADAVKSYAVAKGEWDTRLANVTALYKKHAPNADPTKELIADLVGEYVFTDSNFVNNLSTKNRNVFQKIYDEIKWMCKIATAGSEEARKLMEVKRVFDKAWRDSNTKADNNVKNSISEVDTKKMLDNSAVDNENSLTQNYERGEANDNGRVREVPSNYAEEQNDSVDGERNDGRRDILRTKEGSADGRRYSGDVGEAQAVAEWRDLDPSVRKAVKKVVNSRIKTSSNSFDLYNYIVGLTGKSESEMTVHSYRKAVDKLVEDLYKSAMNDHPAIFENDWKIMGEDTAKLRKAILEAVNPKPKTHYSLSEDSDGNQLSNEQQDFFKDSVVRDENGNLKVMYHGTRDGGFHTFDSNYSDDDTSFFFTDRNDVASSYSGTSETYTAKTFHTAGDFNQFFAEIGATEYSAVEENGKFKLLEDGDEIAESDTPAGLYEEFRDWSGKGYGEVNYKVYLNLKNPLEIDANGSNWDAIEFKDANGSIRFEVQNVNGRWKIKDKIDGGYLQIDRAIAWTKEEYAQEALAEYVEENPYTVRHKTREIAQYAKAEGYDGVIFKNLVDIGGYGGDFTPATVAIAFDSNQIKSVGNTNPTPDNDIRYSISEDIEATDKAYLDAVNRGDMDVVQKLVDEASKRAGFAVNGYHGTTNLFYVFDTSKSNIENDWGRGIYATTSEEDAQANYASDDGADLKNRIERLAESMEYMEEYEDMDYEQRIEAARKQLSQGMNNMLHVAFRMENPVVVERGDGGTFFSFESEYDEDLDEYSEPDGTLVDVINHMKDIIYEDYEWASYDADKLDNIYEEAIDWGGLSAIQLQASVDDILIDVTDEDGNMAGKEILRAALERMGFDGIVDKSVPYKFGELSGRRFGGMHGVTEGTTHFIAFNSSQVKLTDPVTYDDNGNVIPLSKRFNVGNDDIRYSISADNEAQTNLRGTYWDDVRLRSNDDIAPVADTAPIANNVQNVQKKATTQDVQQEEAQPMFLDDYAPIRSEVSTLLDRMASVEEQLHEMMSSGEFGEAFNQLGEEWSSLNARTDELQQNDIDQIASLEDADAPLETERHYDNLVDTTAIGENDIADIAKEASESLALKKGQMGDFRNLIKEYSQSENPSREQLFNDIKEKFGTYKERFYDQTIAEAKKWLRTTKLYLDGTITGDIADFADFKKRNRGKVIMSANGGLDVDVAYAEMSGQWPHLFPESITNPTDQLLRIVDVANKNSTTWEDKPFDDSAIWEVANDIADNVADLKHLQKRADADEFASESFDSLVRYVDQHTSNPVAPTPKKATATEDIAPTYDVSGKKDVPDGQQAFMPDAGVPKPITRAELHSNILGYVKSKFAESGFDFDEVLKKAKDLSTFATVDNTPQRVMEKALGYKEGGILSDLTVNRVAQNETNGIRWLNYFVDRKKGMLAEISKQYLIEPGSKESAAAQMFAEGFYVDDNNNIVKYGDAELAEDFPNAKERERIKGLSKDPRIRWIYDDTLARINESRKRNGYPEIPRLDNYFLHFRAMEDTFSRLGLPFNPNDIRAKDLPTDLNGVTADLKPGQPYFASAMHRKGKRTSFDLLGGLERYLSSAKNQIFHIDDIQTLRALRNYIADTYGQANGLDNLDSLPEEEVQEKIEQVYNSHLSTFAKFLNEEANVLAGKTSLIDRGLEGVIGRRGITFLDTVNKQVGSNMVGFNVSSSLTNFLPVVQALAKTNKASFVKGFAQTVANKVGSIFGRGDGFTEASPVIIRRKGADRFYRTPWQKVGDAGYALMSAVDDISTELVARAKYNEFIKKGMNPQDAHIATDKWVSRLMGDRSIGQQPQLYNSKMLGLVTKFQLEVRNQLDSQFYDTIQEAKVSNEDIQNGLWRNAKTAAKIGSTFFQLAALQHLFGKAFESVAGYNPAFDIVDVLIKMFGWDDDEEDEDTVLDNIEEGFLALLEDLPYTSTFTGGRVPISSALPIKEFVTGKDQYGNEKSRWETFGEAIPYYLLPGGYGQAKKTVNGLSMFDDDHPIAGSYTDSGSLRFPVEDTIASRIQAGVFGQWANENARDYIDNERNPLKKNQIQEYRLLGIPIQEYWEYREGLSGLDTLAEKADYINSLDLPIEKKNLLINNLADRKDPINMKDYGKYGDFEEFDFAQKNPEKYDFLKKNGISYKEFKNFDKDTKEAYEWAFDNPEKYEVSKAVSEDFGEYWKYREYIGNLDAKDENGNSVNGLKKERVTEYINGLNIDYGQKIILFRSYYPKDDTYCYDIVDYLNNRNDISYRQMVTILEELDMKVHDDGTVTWD